MPSNPWPSTSCWINPSLVECHHYLFLTILGHVGLRYWVRLLCHLAFGHSLVCFHSFVVHSVALIVCPLSMKQETWPAYICLHFLMVCHSKHYVNPHWLKNCKKNIFLWHRSHIHIVLTYFLNFILSVVLYLGSVKL